MQNVYEKIINYPLNKIFYFPNATELFKTTSIDSGVTITLFDYKSDKQKIYFENSQTPEKYNFYVDLTKEKINFTNKYEQEI